MGINPMGRCFSRYKDTPEYITDLSRENRLKPTMQEEKLWGVISGKKVNGLKFRRQFPIGRYIVDFYNHANRLVIEIDGEINNDNKEYDKNRDAFLAAHGYKVIRFTNYEIDSNVELILEQIRSSLKVHLRGI